MTRAATAVQHFARLVTHMHDGERALEALAVHGFFFEKVVAQKKVALRAVARLLASQQEAIRMAVKTRVEKKYSFSPFLGPTCTTRKGILRCGRSMGFSSWCRRRRRPYRRPPPELLRLGRKSSGCRRGPSVTTKT